MRLAGWLLPVLLVGCAAGTADDSEKPRDAKTIESALDSSIDSTLAGDSDAIEDTPETISLFDVEDTYEAPPDTTPPDGCGIPKGTTASASGSYSSTPDLAIDADPATYWNSGGYTGWILLTFAKTQTIDSVTITALATPSTSETYTVIGTQSGVESTIGVATYSVTGSMTALPSIKVTKDGYDAIKIDVGGGSASWIAIGDVTMHKIGCP